MITNDFTVKIQVISLSSSGNHRNIWAVLVPTAVGPDLMGPQKRSVGSLRANIILGVMRSATSSKMSCLQHISFPLRSRDHEKTEVLGRVRQISKSF